MDFCNKVFLAPMAGVTDFAFRTIARRYGADCCISEMISAKAVHYKDRKTADLAYISENDLPIGIQIFGHEPEIMGECADLISGAKYEYHKNDIKPTFIDINMGCPVKKIVNSSDGSALMKNPQLCGGIVRRCVDNSSVPVTVKIRAGWDKDSVNCEEIARIAEANGASAVTVHARTREQMYEPYADWKYIKAVKQAVRIPVIGNGDIFSSKDAERMINETGCDSIMVGRGALGNPFIFDEIKTRFEGKSYTPPDIYEKIAVVKSHIKLLIDDKGEKIGVCEARKHVSWYLKGLEHSANSRMRVNRCETMQEIFNILDEYII